MFSFLLNFVQLLPLTCLGRQTQSNDCKPVGTKQVQVKPESQAAGQGTDQKGAWAGTGMAMTQLTTATCHSVRDWGPTGRRCGGSRGDWTGPARSMGGTSYCTWILPCLKTVCHANVARSPTRIFQSDCFHAVSKYPLKNNAYLKMYWMLQLWTHAYIHIGQPWFERKRCTLI